MMTSIRCTIDLDQELVDWFCNKIGKNQDQVVELIKTVYENKYILSNDTLVLSGEYIYLIPEDFYDKDFEYEAPPVIEYT